MLASNVLPSVHRGQVPTLTQLGLEAHGGAVLIGAQGSEVVASLLRRKGPNAAVQELQAKYGLQQQLCKPLLQMLDLLDMSRRDAHLYILNKARKLLLDWVAASRSAAQPCSSEGGLGPESPEDIELQEKLERLLNASFKYMGLPELKQVPIEVMDSMSHVPAPYLKQLAEDREIFNALPAAVKQQVYEYDRNLLQQDAVQYIAAYKYELGTLLATLNIASSRHKDDLYSLSICQKYGTADPLPSLLATGRGAGASASSGAPAAASALLPSRKTVRSGSETIKQLRDMVGNSGKIYSHLVELCEVRLKESSSLYLGCKELSYCALRTQLLMSLHDVREALPHEGRSYDLVWLLDAALLQRRLSVQHMRKLGELFADHVKAPAWFLEEEDDQWPAAGGQVGKPGLQAAAGRKRHGGSLDGGSAEQSGSGKRRRSGAGSAWQSTPSGGSIRARGQLLLDDTDEAADADDMSNFIEKDELDAEDVCGANVHTQDRWLAEAGMVLRDPPVLHLLSAQVLDVLYRCMQQGRLPGDAPQLPWLLQLMQLAVVARTSLREAQYSMPPPPTRQLHTVWPELLVMLVAGEMDAQPHDQDRQRCPGSTTGQQQSQALQDGSSEGWRLLVAEYDKEEVFRKVLQMSILDRLSNGDLMTAHHLLLLLSSSRHFSSAAAIPEYAPFAYSLASSLQDLVKARQLRAGSSFWSTAVDQVLLAMVDADSQVHIEVLRLLLSVCKDIDSAHLAASLGDMLLATKGSRARAATQKKKIASMTAQHISQMGLGSEGVPGYISMGGAASEWSDGFRTVRSLKYSGSSDGFSELYRKIVVVGGIQDKQHHWPQELRSFMQELDERRLVEEQERRAMRQAAMDEAEQLAAAEGQDEAERNEVLYFRHYEDQKRAMVSRLLQRACVMQALGEPWDQIVIKRTKGKKPFYAGHIARDHAPNFNYNVSHEGDFTVLASESHCLCGVDVAAPHQLRRKGSSRPLLEQLSLMRSQLCSSEWTLLQSLAADEGAMEAAFQAMWSCKEAFIKARGDGVGFEPLSRIQVQLPVNFAQPTGISSREPAAAAPAAEQQGQHLGPGWQVFKSTMHQPSIEDEELQVLLDAPTPAFSLLTVEDLLPTQLQDAYIAAGQ
eukprot:gene13351-13479_t